MRRRASRMLPILLLSLLGGGAEGSVLSDPVDECRRISDDAERLRCFDKVSGSLPAGEGEVPEGTEPGAVGTRSILSRLWEMDRESRRRTFAITPYRDTYILPFTHNTTPNEDPIREDDPDKEVRNQEVAFQISIKIKLWQDIFDRDADMWIGYTQRSFWQFYDFAGSSPFRETDYEPELLINFRTAYKFLGLTGRYVNVGLNHQSNGRSEPLSRSWNRAVANLGFERGEFLFLLHAWYRIPDDDADDDNPEIEDYMGYGQVDLYYLRHGHRFGISLRNNLHTHDNRGALMLDWSFPLIMRVSGYVQYFNGYGESLLDYNASVNRIGIGFVLKEW